jgi:hypothetical protein
VMKLHTRSEWTKDNPLAVLGSLIAGAVVAAITIDDRYAHAGELDKVNRSISVASLESSVTVLELRRANLADKVYELNLKRPTPEVIALRERYKADLDEVTRQQRDKQRLIDEIKTGKTKP